MNRDPAPKASKRVVLYVRRSIDDGDVTCSLPEQERACRSYSKSIGEVVRVYRENESGVSGFDRPIFQEMLVAANRHEFDAIVCLDVSRFGRFDVDERGYWMTHLKRAHVEVRFVHDDARLAGEAGQIMGAVLQHSAREHSVKTALRVTMGLVAAVERGCWPGGRAPLGYRIVRRDGWNGAGRRDARLVVHEPEAKVVREIFRLYAEGKGLLTVCDELNAKQYRTRRGLPFGQSALKKILGNPIYKGDIVRGQEHWGWRRNKSPRGAAKFYHGSSQGVVPIGSETDGFAKTGAAPVIIEPALWDKVQEVWQSKTFTRTGGEPGFFSGIGLCGVCGRRLVQRSGRTTKGVRYSYLGCGTCRHRGLTKSFGDCGRVNVSYSRLLDSVLEVLRAEAHKIDPKWIAAAIRKRLDNGSTQPDVAGLEAKRKKLAVRRRDLVLAETDFERAALKELAAEDARLAAQIEAAKREAARKPDVDALVEVALEAARTINAPRTDAGKEALKKALHVFIEKIVVKPADRLAPKPVDVTLYTIPGVAFPASGRLLEARSARSPPLRGRSDTRRA
jgi:DNA invertase Pin-like site-specific DNA recombinase